MYKDFRKLIAMVAGTLFFFMVSAQTAYNVVKWGGTLTVNPNVFGAGSLAGITDGLYNDNNRMTITGVTDRWVKFQTNGPVVISSYSVTTYSSYRPTGWTFSASNDGLAWVDLDVQTGQTFTSYTARNFVLAGNTTPYTYYRISVTATASASYLSFSEFELFTTSSVPYAPVLQGSAVSGTEAGFSWNYTLLAADTFFLERSLNGTDYTLVNKTTGLTTSYFDQTLTPSTLFYYRLRSKNAYGYSPYSNVVQVTTNALSGQSADITDDGGRIYVSADNTGGPTAGEGSYSFIDNSIASKWLVFTGQASGNLAAIYKPTGSYVVTSYVLGTANDAPARDPRSWSFSGSNDSTTWVRLDTQMNQLGNNAARFSYYRYIIPAPGSTPYKYYRILMTANNGATDGVRFQIAEWQILGIDANAPAIPASLAVTGTTTSSVSLSWSQTTPPDVTAYRLQRGEDGLNFSTIVTLPAAATAYTDQNLYDSTKYYYRLQALGTTSTAVSGWSNVANAQTGFVAGVPRSPRDLKVVIAIDSVIGLTWKDRSFNETGFKVQRSSNGVTFSDLRTIDANSTAFNDSTVWPATKYYYRVAAFNAQGTSVYSNIDSATTAGYNHPPVATPSAMIKNICSNSAEYSFDITGLTAGPNYERTQSISIASVTVDSAQFFTNINFTPVVNGVANIRLKGSGLAAFGDTVVVSVLMRDNGGTANYGNDSSVYTLKLVYLPLTVAITADRDVLSTPRYVTVHLTAATNYASTTPTYLWDDAAGIEGTRNGIILRVKPTLQTTYTVHATSIYGCQATAQITLTPDAEKFISNVLTPNGDGKNDKWIIWNISENPNNSVKVFDRNGRLVFSKKNYSNDWDGRYNGKILEEGAYTYVIDFGNGRNPVTGILNIIRDHK